MNKRKKFLGQYVVVSSFLLVLLLSLVGGFATQIVKTIQYNKEIAQLKSNIKNVDKEIKDLDTLATDKVEKLAIGDPESVPAGKYAKEVLDNTKLYDKVENKLVLAKDVKEVLSWVQKGSADAGFVYLSDTVGAKGIKVALTTDEDTHSTISYPIAVLKASEKQDKAKTFEDFLLSDDGQTILEKYGFKKAN